MSDEFDYFGDPRIGKLFDLVLQMATELHVTGQRLRAIEALLVRDGVLSNDAVDAFVPAGEEQQVLDRQRDQLMARFLRILTESGPAEHPLRDRWEAELRCKTS
jgi:hypothetical protein